MTEYNPENNEVFSTPSEETVEQDAALDSENAFQDDQAEDQQETAETDSLFQEDDNTDTTLNTDSETSTEDSLFDQGENEQADMTAAESAFDTVDAATSSQSTETQQTSATADTAQADVASSLFSDATDSTATTAAAAATDDLSNTGSDLSDDQLFAADSDTLTEAKEKAGNIDESAGEVQKSDLVDYLNNSEDDDYRKQATVNYVIENQADFADKLDIVQQRFDIDDLDANNYPRVVELMKVIDKTKPETVYQGYDKDQILAITVGDQQQQYALDDTVIMDSLGAMGGTDDVSKQVDKITSSTELLTPIEITRTDIASLLSDAKLGSGCSDVITGLKGDDGTYAGVDSTVFAPATAFDIEDVVNAINAAGSGEIDMTALSAGSCLDMINDLKATELSDAVQQQVVMNGGEDGPSPPNIESYANIRSALEIYSNTEYQALLQQYGGDDPTATSIVTNIIKNDSIDQQWKDKIATLRKQNAIEFLQTSATEPVRLSEKFTSDSITDWVTDDVSSPVVYDMNSAVASFVSSVPKETFFDFVDMLGTTTALSTEYSNIETLGSDSFQGTEEATYKNNLTEEIAYEKQHFFQEHESNLKDWDTDQLSAIVDALVERGKTSVEEDLHQVIYNQLKMFAMNQELLSLGATDNKLSNLIDSTASVSDDLAGAVNIDTAKDSVYQNLQQLGAPYLDD